MIKIKKGDKWNKYRTEFNVYHGCKTRCENVNDKDYARYGGRGIRFKYNSFEEFLNDIGIRPSKKHSIDRINNDGNYEVGNCRWSTVKEQANNRRTNLVFNGETATQASIRLGGTRMMVSERIRRGWDLEQAFTTPANTPTRIGHRR